LIAAGVAGAIVAMAVFAIGTLLIHNDPGIAALDGRLGAVEQQAQDLAARPAPVSVDPRRMDDLAAKLAEVEAAATTPRPVPTDLVLANRMPAIESETKLNGERMVELTRRAEEVAAVTADARARIATMTDELAELRATMARQAATRVDRDEFTASTTRLAAIEQRTTELGEQLARQAALELRDRAARSALTAGALRAVVERGEPFGMELSAAKAFAADSAALAPLEPFARDGVPSAALLGRELSALVPALELTGGSTHREGGYFDRLAANAEKIVRVRPFEEIPGEDAAAIVSRSEASVARGDIAAALAELGRLPPTQRAPAQAWMARAQAQIAAIALARRLAAESVAALDKPVP
jgi:hypothetical protein